MTTRIPKITVVTPSYNQGEYIEETIQSVVNQDYPNLEYIIIDGGSSDQTTEIIKKYDDKISYWVSEPDKGQSHAIKKGFEKSTGEIITWLNSDDLLYKDALKNVSKHFTEQPDIDLLLGQYIEFDEKGDRPLHKIQRTDGNYIQWTYSTPFAQPSTFYRRELFDKVGGIDDSFQFSMDNDLFKKMIFYGAKYKYHNDIISKFRWHESSKSTNLIETCRNDDRTIYCTFLKSLDNSIANECIELLKKLDLYTFPQKNYKINIDYSDKEVLQSFAHFLAFYLVQYYIHGDLEKGYQITAFFKKHKALKFLLKTQASRVAKYLVYLPPFVLRSLK